MTITQKRKIAVLSTDYNSVQVDTNSDLADQLIQLLKIPGQIDLNQYEIIKYDVITKQEYPDLNDPLLIGIFISGSTKDSFENDPWNLKLLKFIKIIFECLGNKENNIKLCGLCYGHQIILRALGSKLIRNPKGWEMGITELEINEVAKDVFKEIFDSNNKNRNTIKIVEMHRDIVTSPPLFNKNLGDIHNLASSPLCEYQGFYTKGKLLTLQGHPEFSKKVCFNLLEKRFSDGLISKEFYDDALKRTQSIDNDGDIIAKSIVRFFTEE